MSNNGKSKLGAFESLVENARNKTVDVTKFTRQIWLAGLSAYAKDSGDSALEEVAFEDLVREGKLFEKRTHNSQNNGISKKQNIATGNTWQKLESVFDERLSAALKRLGICTNSDIKKLDNEIELLSKIIADLSIQDDGGNN